MQAQTTPPQGFSPDSPYATWGAEERDASDRMEADYNAQARARLALLAADRGHPIYMPVDCPDSMLSNLLKRWRRNLEDVEDGSLGGGKRRARMLRARITDIEVEQGRRSALAESWRATEDGTQCYSAFQGRGGLAAVLDHGATPPSYDLAVTLDWERHQHGLSTVLAWDEAERAAA